ncbi:MAG: hypothetical protein HYZ28_20100 [Myxococcales bacterium]|nr:hypothetical protein [Myxococcales bacterium]
MATFKRLLAFLLGGAILGAVVASLVAPGLISWYNTPGAMVPPGFDLSPFARQVTNALLRAQLIGAGVGAAAAAALAVFVFRAKKKAEAPLPATPAPVKAAQPADPPM